MTWGAISLESCSQGLCPALPENNCSYAVARSPKIPQKAGHWHVLLSTICKGSHSLPDITPRVLSMVAWPGWGPPVWSLITDLATSCQAAVGHKGLQDPGTICRDLLVIPVVPLAFIFLTFTAFQSNTDFFSLERVKRRFFRKQCFGIIYFSF